MFNHSLIGKLIVKEEIIKCNIVLVAIIRKIEESFFIKYMNLACILLKTRTNRKV